MNLAERPSALSPLSYRTFRRVWIASMSSNLGGLIQSVGAAWLMTSIAETADMVALVQASVTLPIMLLSLVAGAMADNLDRRAVMLGAQIFMFVVSIALAVCAWLGLITPWLLLMFTFLIGCGTAFNAPAWQASVGDMVPRMELPGAVALNSMGYNIARSAGPALGGAIVAVAGVAIAFGLNAISYVPLIMVLFGWRPPPDPRVLPRETLGAAMAAGARYVAMSPALRVVLLRSAVFCVGASAVMALMPLIAKERVAGGPITYGLLLGAFGVGAVLGAMASARLREVLSTEAIVRWSCVGFALATAIAGLSNSLAVTIAVMLLGGAGWVLALSTFNVTVQMSTPRWVVGRSLSLYQMAAFGGLAAGSWLWGLVAAAGSVKMALLQAVGVVLACALLGRWRPLAQAENIDLEPLHDWKEPDTAVPVESRTGPVVIAIEYLIREEDILEFLAAMAERRRIRRRDGARNWRLLRDLGDRQIWVERYETATWLDYLRHNTRLTRDDAIIPERVRALHIGPEPPRVRRMIERQTSTLPMEHAPGGRELVELP